MELTNNVALVTGGASGLGRATAESLLKQSMKVAVFDLDEQAGQELVQDYGEANVFFQKVDVTDEDAVVTAVDAVVSKFGLLRVCINCAGIATAHKVVDREGEPMPLANFSKVISINLVGSFNVARVAAAKMAKNPPVGEAGERGVIINTASIAAYEGQIGQSAYAASKGGIVGMTLPMARDLAPLAIRVMTIAPGLMGTPLLLSMPENVQQALVSNIQYPKRLGLPGQEFAGLVEHIIGNSYLNGETIRLDAALRMPPR